LQLRPVIAITTGDPAGIGPEIVIKAIRNPGIHSIMKPLLIGDADLILDCAKSIGIGLKLNRIESISQSRFKSDEIDIIDIHSEEEIEVGKISPAAGKASVSYIEKASELAVSRKIDGIATAPINKESVKLSGYPPLGHTELFAQFTKSDNVLTIFLMNDVKIFFVTRHLSLREAIDALATPALIETIVSANSAMQNLGYEGCRMTVAALNPHAGEGGLFGREEIEYIIPAIQTANKMGINVDGPIGADSVFHLALEGKYDCVVSLYHDQGHIASKTRDFYGTITLTMGLPVLRTSVDHGTGLDIAWKGIANHLSMEKAIFACAELVIRASNW